MRNKTNKDKEVLLDQQPQVGQQLSEQQQQMLDEYTAETELNPTKEMMEGPKSLKVITNIEIAAATEILMKYKDGKSNLDSRIIANEQWWKLRHWDLVRKDEEQKKAIEPSSAWLFNSIANKHADAMDNYPEPCVLPRSADDDLTAKTISAILPVIQEQNNYEQVYSDTWWYKLKQGTGVKGIFWNSEKSNGLGDIDIKKCDLLNLFWEPGVTDIQNSPNLFHLALMDNKTLMNKYPKEKYPDLHLKNTTTTIEVSKYVYDDSVDTTEKSVIVDWYYKKNGVLHYCKYVGENILYSSENEPDYTERGYYDHGLYPFVFDTLFMTEGTPSGFGYIDIMKDCQMYIDKLGSVILENALMASKPRYFIRDDGSVNETEFTDYSKTLVHTSGGLDDNSLRQIVTSPLNAIYVSILNNKVDELKETSGNRDFSQGSTSSGVTAASAIAALQEAGSKLSRDMVKSSYRAYSRECYLQIELIRQFYDEPRCFRITGENNAHKFEKFDNTTMIPQAQGQAFDIELGSRLPIFDIEVVAAKKSSYTRMAQNELAIQFYSLGFFNPQMTDQTLAALEMMDFDSKDKVIEKVTRNGTMYDQLMMMQQQIAQMAAVIGMQNNIDPNQLAQQQEQPQSPQVSSAIEQNRDTGSAQAAQSANSVASPK